jgi:hypothetical protein
MNPQNPEVRIDAPTAGELMAQQGIDVSTLPKAEIVAAPAPNSAPNDSVPAVEQTVPSDHLLPPTAA